MSVIKIICKIDIDSTYVQQHDGYDSDFDNLVMKVIASTDFKVCRPLADMVSWLS